MAQVEYWRWLLPRERDGRLVLARWRMTDEQARAYPGAVRAPGPPELRE